MPSVLLIGSPFQSRASAILEAVVAISSMSSRSATCRRRNGIPRGRVSFGGTSMLVGGFPTAWECVYNTTLWQVVRAPDESGEIVRKRDEIVRRTDDRSEIVRHP